MDLAWTDFVNSLERDWRGGGPAEDHLAQAAWQSAFLAKWGLDAPMPAPEGDLAAAARLRDLLCDLAGRVAGGGALEGEGLAALNGFMAGAPVRRSLVAEADGHYRLEDAGLAGGGWPGVLGEVAASFARTLAEMDPARIRICANPDCRWAFYDDTRNGSRRFCNPAGCGNLVRVRRFRARRRQG